MNRELISKAIGDIDDRQILEASRYDPKGIYSISPERIAMKDEHTNSFIHPQRRFRRALSIAAVVCLILALGITGFAVYQLSMNRREAKPAEVFQALPSIHYDDEAGAWVWDTSPNGTLENVKLVFDFDEPEDCNAIRFKPGWIPSEPTVVGATLQDEEGWYTYLDGATLDYDQPYLISVYYASQFVNDGHMLLLNYTPGEITEETWGDYQITKFDAVSYTPGISFFGIEPHTVERSYYIMFHQTLGYIIVISGVDADIATLERIGKNLEIDMTDDVISSADYHEYNVPIDGALG